MDKTADWADRAADLLALALEFQNTSSAYVRVGRTLELITSEDRALIAELLIREAHTLAPGAN